MSAPGGRRGGTYRVLLVRERPQGETGCCIPEGKLRRQEVAFRSSDKTAYGKGLADANMGSNRSSRRHACHVRTYTAGEKEFSALVSKMKQEGIEVRYVGGTTPKRADGASDERNRACPPFWFRAIALVNG